MFQNANATSIVVLDDRTRLLPVALLSILTLGVAAAVLESTPIASAHDVPAADTSGSGLSILGVLRLLLLALFELLGVEIELSAPIAGSGPSIGVLAAAIAALRSVAGPLLLAGVVATLVILVGRRIPGSGILAITSLLPDWLRSTEGAATSDSTTETWPPAEPKNRVSEAWVAMTESIEMDRPRVRTPMEWADSAIDAGFDDDAVANLTALFRETRYGPADEPTEYEREAERELERLGRDSP